MTWRARSIRFARPYRDGRMQGLIWHVITGEYAPARGGVADYTHAVARALAAAGDEVHVWAPSVGSDLVSDPGVHLHPLPEGFGPRGLLGLSRELSRLPGPKRILVQYVPHAFGMRALNVPFCAWVAALRDAEVWVMFHEVALPWHSVRRWKVNVGAAVTRIMANLLVARADRVFISTRSWVPMLRGMAPYWRGEPTWLPIPSNVPASVSNVTRESARSHFRPWPSGTKVVGHFGSCGSLMVPLLRVAVGSVLNAEPDRIALIVGRGSEAFVRGLEADSRWRGRVTATGELELSEIAERLLACDVLIQPYPDGVSTRRTTVMAGLALGVPVVTNEGHLSEPWWRGCGAVELTRTGESFGDAVNAVLADPSRASSLGERGRRLYTRCFSLERTVKTLRGDVDTLQGSWIGPGVA
jgi:glycosyltransferase involved in cell wall biosynthesis